MNKIDRNYRDWFDVKTDVQIRKNRPHFKEWQIWWCAVGENVGVEINGMFILDLEERMNMRLCIRLNL